MRRPTGGDGIFPEDDFADDDFRVGIQVGRRMVRLYAPFSASDIIIASPLGLRLITGAEGDAKREFDFLSSIEMVLLDRADVLSMQNWDHVLEILKVTNVQPSTLPEGADISRLRPWIADGLARRFRQTVVLTDTYNPLMDSVIHDTWEEGKEGNWRGMDPHAALYQARHGRQVLEASDKYLKFFEERYWKDIGAGLGRLAICVSSYFEYLRLRAFLKKNDASFVAIDEYSSNKSMGRARQFFLTQQKKVILMTERLLWYRKLRIKGIQHYLFYGVPERPEIYEDLLRDVRVPSQCYSTCLYSSCDGYALERLVGRRKAAEAAHGAPWEGICILVNPLVVIIITTNVVSVHLSDPLLLSWLLGDLIILQFFSVFSDGRARHQPGWRCRGSGRARGRGWGGCLCRLASSAKGLAESN
ncbi:hypothetical protein FOZ60_006892 [Perkinsus olseni]|uniref:U3 small nucleolar RNA-associated protein 25 n=1 Tax=Perkinsus olseni TaxID=32597 RepID=A0A7J6NNE4_PEROL|nr:hypothetical protein FOZ60_006892 [Perkinsus olseni]